MKFHSAASIVPHVDQAGFLALKRDIQINGQQVPIVVWEGAIVDGRSRLRACEELGLQPKLQVLHSLPGGSAVMYVLSANLHRRSLSSSQRAMVAARARKHLDYETSHRRAGKGMQGVARGDARDLAGRMVGVSGKSVDYATKVLERGIPEVIAACDAGELAVSRAARVVLSEAEEQRELLGALRRSATPSASSAEVCVKPAREQPLYQTFDLLIARSRELGRLIDNLASVSVLVENGQFDRRVVLGAVHEVVVLAEVLAKWAQAARRELAPDARARHG